MSLEAYEDLNNIITFYSSKFEIDHDLSAALLPSNQLFASGLLRLFDVPDSGVGLYHMRKVMDYFLFSYMHEMESPLSHEFFELYEIFWSNVCEESLKEEGTIPKFMKGSVKGYIGLNPVYSFLFISCFHGGASQVQSDELLITFLSFAPYFFQKINKYKQSYSNSFLERLCLVARKLIIASDNLTIKASFMPSDKERQYIGQAALSLNSAKTESIFEVSNKTYVYDLLFREGRKELNKDDYKKSLGFNTTKRWAHYENGLIISTPFELALKENKQNHFKPTGKRKTVYSLDQVDYKRFNVSKENIASNGESHIDYVYRQGLELPAEFFIDPWKAKTNSGVMLENMAFGSNVLTWEKDVISKPTIKDILQILRNIKREVKSILLLSMLMGIKEKTLKEIHCNNMPEDDEYDLSVEVVKSRFKGLNYDSNKKVFWIFHDFSSRSDKFIQLHEYHVIRLPSFIHASMPTLDQCDRMFSMKNLRDAKRFLVRIGNDGIGKITLSRLVKTFEAYFINSFGLPVLFADLLSGGVTYHLESQHYYVTQDVKHLTQQWHGAVDSFLNEYQSSSLMNFRNPPLQTYQLPRTKLSRASEYLGAKNTPEKTSLKKHFMGLYNSFPHSMDELVNASNEQWNAYIAYLYGMFSVCTGQRPLRDPIPSIKELSLEERIIHITDKNSHHHREERCVPLVDILFSALNTHRKLLIKWRERVLYESCFDFPPEPTFFPLINESKKKIISASPAQIDHVIRENKHNDYIEELKNGFRHYLLTSLFNYGVPQGDIDWISGHRCQGMEPESMLSASSWNMISKRVKRNIEESVVKPLGLQEPCHD